MGNENEGQSKETTGKLEAYVSPEKPWEFKNEKPMHKWSQNEVKNYMTSLTYNDTTRNVMEKKITGKDLLLCRSAEEVAKKIGIPLDKAEGIYELLQIEKQHEMHGVSEEKEKELGQSRNARFLGTRTWKNKAMIKWIPHNVKSWFVEEFSGKVDTKIKIQILDTIDEYVLNGDRISNVDDGKVLAGIFKVDVKIGEMIYAAIEKRMLSEGGNEEKKETEGSYNIYKDSYRFRKLPWRKYEFIKLSQKPDCIMGYTKEDGIDRAEMACGHAIAADTMFYFIKSIIEKNKEAVFIVCPVPECDKEWDWNTCLRIADMDDDEINKYNAIRKNRKPKAVITSKSCPFCFTAVFHPELLKNFRVRCMNPNCTGGEWCFGCEQKWRGSGQILCGNANCTLVSGINKLLQNCETHKVKYLNVPIPLYRACPTCLTAIEHLPGCKHMGCQAKGCGTNFCFICLAVYDANKGGWPKSCNEGVVPDEKTGHTAHNYLCKMAPRQNFV